VGKFPWLKVTGVIVSPDRHGRGGKKLKTAIKGIGELDFGGTLRRGVEGFLRCSNEKKEAGEEWD